MKLIIFIVALLVTTPIFVFSQAAKDEQTLKQIEQELLNALLKNDAPVFERYVDDAFIFTGPDGGVMNKTENIAALKSGDLKFESSKVDDMKVQLHGNSAIVTYQATDKGVYSGETDHMIPWQTDQRFNWRTEVVNAVEVLSKVVV